MLNFLVKSAEENFLCQADDYTHAVEQFLSAYGHEDVTVHLVLPMSGPDNVTLKTESEAPDIEWHSKPQDRLWIGVAGKLDVKIKHDDDGIVVDVFEAGSVGECVASTWQEWLDEDPS